MKNVLLPLISLLALTAALSAQAETPEEKGLAIAREADVRDAGWGDYSADMKMVLKNRQGEESIRDIRSKTFEMANDGDKSLIIFDKPADVKGTALLSFSHKQGSDDQWLYLPALKRVKRIASDNKSGPFMGSEFAYEDITSQEVEKYTYKWLRDEQLNGKDVFVIERYPTDKSSGYTRQIVWMDKADYNPLKIEYYDRKNAQLKTLVFDKYQKYLDKYWRSSDMFMDNHQTGKTTRLLWENYQFKTGLTEGDFDQNALQRAK
jgi:outer membrane lipoprotein-sorting protein